VNPRIQVIAVLGSVGIILLVFQLIRQRKLREEYALLWFGASVALIVVSLWRGGLEMAARLAGVAYAPSVLFLGAMVLGFFLAMHYSISLSRLAEQNKQLAQELALLRQRLDEVDHQLARSHASAVVAESTATEQRAQLTA
jgi:hypothetical protein